MYKKHAVELIKNLLNWTYKMKYHIHDTYSSDLDVFDSKTYTNTNSFLDSNRRPLVPDADATDPRRQGTRSLINNYSN
jgi:hypothetical protein